MTQELAILTVTALSIGFFHTLFGPDHYLPFIMMARAQQWSKRKTILITLVCGVGHVLSSVVLGLIGVAMGVAVIKLEAIESFEGIRGYGRARLALDASKIMATINEKIDFRAPRLAEMVEVGCETPASAPRLERFSSWAVRPARSRMNMVNASRSPIARRRRTSRWR